MIQKLLLPLGLLVLLQILDVAIHVAAGQLELLRVAASMIIVVGALGAMSGTPGQGRTMIFVAGIMYCGLNIWFLYQAGFINPLTTAPRLLLIAFVVASLVLALWMGRRMGATTDPDPN